MPKRLSLEGQKFNRLSVIRLHKSDKKSYWECLCDCGNFTIVSGGDLKSGNTRSCGCQKAISLKEKFTIHGMSKSPEHRVWNSIQGRCYNENNRAYKSYGGRGIAVCDRWRYGENGRHGFQCFLNDMGTRPSASHSIERMDNDGPYAPWNCKWATIKEQSINKRNSVKVILDGKEVPLKDACKFFGINYYTAHNRILAGMPPEEAMSKPLYSRGRKK